MRRGEHRGLILNGIDERDVIGCAHCRFQIVVKAAKGCESVQLYRCQQCHRTICQTCAAALSRPDAKCAPFERWLEREERRGEFLKAAGV